MDKFAPMVICSAFVALAPLTAHAAAACAQAYDKVLPYDLPIGGEQASIQLHNEVRFSYDCQTVLARAEASAAVQFLKLDLDVLQAELVAEQSQTAPSAGYARLTVAGYEVAREDFDLENVVETTLSPDTDFDFSQTQMLNVGPLMIPLNYGIEGNAALELTAGWRDQALEAEANPMADAKVYVQVDAKVQFAQVLARGDMILLKDKLNNVLRTTLEKDEQGQGMFVRVSANSQNNLQALEGSVFVKAQVGVGALARTFERELFAWDGIARDDMIAEYSERFPLTAAR